VVAVTRRGRDRVIDAGRDTEPLRVTVRTAAGALQQISAAAVIDASGTWSGPNPLGADGIPAPGEAEAHDRISYRIPDLGDARAADRYAGRHVVVAGSGHSALTTLVGLTADGHRSPARISWLLRRNAIGQAFGGGDADQLPARGALGERARQAVESGRIEVIAGFRTERVEQTADSLTLVSLDGRRLESVDEVIVATGFRPDLSWLSEIRLDLDPRLQAPTMLAPLIDPNQHSCGTVYPHGHAELAHPEPGFYLAGMKSYGRAPTFLALTGYEQVRSIVAAICGDRQAADSVQLTLPETGVCSGNGLTAEPTESEASSGCCGTPAPQLIELATRPV
jgi:hypothetical protein